MIITVIIMWSRKCSGQWSHVRHYFTVRASQHAPAPEANAALHPHPAMLGDGPAVSSGSMNGQQVAVDDVSEIASETGRSSRIAYRYELARPADGEEGGKSTLKDMFKKNKKSKQIELDALR